MDETTTTPVATMSGYPVRFSTSVAPVLKLLPATVTATDEARSELVGVIDDTTGPEGVVTANPFESVPVCASGLVTTTSHDPTTAPAGMETVPVRVVEDTNAIEVAVISVLPERFSLIDAPLAKPVP